MPEYFYTCTSCEHSQNIHQKITDEKIKNCPTCGQPKFSRRIRGANTTFRFTGSGYYITDYANPSQSNLESKDKATKS